MNVHKFAFLYVGLFVSVGALWADDDKDGKPTAGNSNSTAVDLVEVLRGAVVAGEPTSAFELVGRNDTIVEFDSGIESSAVIDFRLQLDRKNESLRWAVKEKKETFSNSADGNGAPRAENAPRGKNTPGQVTYHGVSIQGGDLTTFSASSSRPATAHFETFEEAMAAALIPSPQYFGVVPYRLFKDGKQELKRLETIIMDSQAKVQVGALPAGVRYVARNQLSDQRSTVYTWEFSLPDYLPQSLTIDQSISGGKLTRIGSQRLFWETSPRGQRRPFRIAAENPIVKRKPEGGFEIGRKSVDLEMVWLGPEKINKMAFVSFVDIQKYLDIGEAIAKQRNSRPSKPD